MARDSFMRTVLACMSIRSLFSACGIAIAAFKKSQPKGGAQEDEGAVEKEGENDREGGEVDDLQAGPARSPFPRRSQALLCQYLLHHLSGDLSP